MALLLLFVLMLEYGCSGTAATTKKDSSFRSVAVKQGQNESSRALTGTSEASKRCAELWPLIRKAAEETGVEPALLVGVVRVESNFRNDVRSTAGAIGLTQVLKKTAKAHKCGDISEPYKNLVCGARVLASFLNYYDGNVILGLSGYNAGHAMPEAARQANALPANISYVENVLWSRARFLFRGCAF